MRTESPRFDVAIVLIPRTPGDSIGLLGQPVEALKGDPAALSALDDMLRDLYRARRPGSRCRPRSAK